MDLSVATVAETLTREFAGLRLGNVVGVLTACVDEYPNADALFMEQAARARLLLLAQSQGTGSKTPGRDALDVSLHDVDLAAEVELTARLMVAANESDHPLAREDLDKILGIGRDETTACGPALPSQRTRCPG